MTDNSLQGQRQNENRLDSIWCAEIGWNIGVLDMSGSPIKDLSTIEPPRWAKWNYDLESIILPNGISRRVVEKEPSRIFRSHVLYRHIRVTTRHLHFDF